MSIRPCPRGAILSIGREEPDPGAGSHPAWAPCRSAKGGLGLAPRLQALRHDHSVRGALIPWTRIGDPEPARKYPRHRGVHPLPQSSRGRGSGRQDRPPPSSTTTATHKHPKVRAWLVRHPRWIFPLHAHQRFMAERSKPFLLGPDPSAGSKCAASLPDRSSRPSRPPSIAMSSSTTTTPSLQMDRRSSPRRHRLSAAGTKR